MEGWGPLLSGEEEQCRVSRQTAVLWVIPPGAWLGERSSAAVSISSDGLAKKGSG